MKYKKHLIFIMTLIIFMCQGINKVYAIAEQGKIGDIGTCFYKDDNNALFIRFNYVNSQQEFDSFSGTIIQNVHDADVVIQTYGGENVGYKSGIIENLTDPIANWQYDTNIINTKAINENYPQGCPNSISVKKTLWWYEISLNSNGGIPVISPDDYFGYLPCKGGNCTFGKDVNVVCSGKADNSLFGDPTYTGTKNADGEYKNEAGEYDPPSVAYMINKVLGIARIIVIAIVFVLGTLDIAKAVISSKEDEMKKAQNTFIKRIIACIVVFLIPTLVSIFMNFSNFLWETSGYETCTFEEITSGGSFAGTRGKS